MKENEEAIVLLNDGERSHEEGHCNSWPKITYVDERLIKPPYCEP